MSFDLAFRLASYGLVAVGFLALALSGEVASWIVLAGFLGLPVTWRLAGRPRAKAASRLARVPPRAWSAVTALVALLAAANVLLLEETIIVAMVELLVAIQLVKLLSARTDRDYFQVYAISFFQLLAAATLSESLGFALSFLLYMLLATWTFLAFHLRQELGAQPAGEPLAARRLVSLPFVATTTLLALGTLLFTVAIFFAFPRVGRGFLQRSGKQVKLTGFSDVVRLGEVGEIKNDPTVVMRVYAPGPDALPQPIRFWRGSAFDRYDGVAWSRSVVDRRQVAGEPGGRIVLAPPAAGTRVVRQMVLLEPLDTNVLFVSGRPLAIELPVGPGRFFPFVYRDGMESVTAPAAPWRRVEYVVESDLARPSPAALRAAAPADGQAQARFLRVPPLDPRVTELAAQVTGGAATAYDKALALERHLRTAYAYSLVVNPTPGVPPLDDFLFNTRTGYCEYSATAMAIMLRTLGIPSRMVSGFLRGEWNEYGGYYLVRQSEAHTWVEAYFPGAGWVAFDPTPPAGTAAGGLNALAAVGQWIDALRSRWNRYVVGYSLSDQVAAARAVRGGTADLAARARAALSAAAGRARSLAAAVRGVEIPAWVAWPSLALLGVILLRGRSLIRRTAVGAYFERRRLNRETLRLYARAVAAAGARGVPREPAETAREHAAQARAAGLEGAEALLEVAHLYEAIRFGAYRATSADVRAARAALDAIRGSAGRPGRRARAARGPRPGGDGARRLDAGRRPR